MPPVQTDGAPVEHADSVTASAVPNINAGRVEKLRDVMEVPCVKWLFFRYKDHVLIAKFSVLSQFGSMSLLANPMSPNSLGFGLEKFCYPRQEHQTFAQPSSEDRYRTDVASKTWPRVVRHSLVDLHSAKWLFWSRMFNWFSYGTNVRLLTKLSTSKLNAATSF